MITKLSDQRILVYYGPIQMTIDISTGDKKRPDIGVRIGEYVLEQFEALIKYIPQLKEMRIFKNTSDEFPKVLNRMIYGTYRSGYKELNILGTVAGSFSDIALEKALELGGTRVIINNGGDLAFKDLNGEPIRIGIPYFNNKEEQLVLTITQEQNIHGVCTSGIGGRSFTKGIATSAIALASDASTADACATYIGNMTDIEDESIIRCKAEEIDSETDIKGQIITLKVGSISRNKRYKALLNGLETAEDLYEKEIIKGAVICIEEDIVKYPDGLNIEYKN